MKFFKHFVDSHRGKSLRRIRRSKLGMAGVGMYWTLTELCAEKMEKERGEDFGEEHCRFAFDSAYLAQELGTKSGHLRNVLGMFQECSLLTWTESDFEIRIEMTKLLESLDRDAKRARPARGQGAARPGQDKEEDKEKDLEERARTGAPAPEENQKSEAPLTEGDIINRIRLAVQGVGRNSTELARIALGSEIWAVVTHAGGWQAVCDIHPDYFDFRIRTAIRELARAPPQAVGQA